MVKDSTIYVILTMCLVFVIKCIINTLDKRIKYSKHTIAIWIIVIFTVSIGMIILLSVGLQPFRNKNSHKVNEQTTVYKIEEITYSAVKLDNNEQFTYNYNEKDKKFNNGTQTVEFVVTDDLDKLHTDEQCTIDYLYNEPFDWITYSIINNKVYITEEEYYTMTHPYAIYESEEN
jgi:hypothetical protein